MMVVMSAPSLYIERNMVKAELYDRVITYFKEKMPVAETELHYRNPYELLVAVLLSAQCTDKRINQVTPALFAAYPTPEAMAQATVDDIYSYIKSVSYPNNKARHLSGMTRMLVSDFGGQVPDNLDDLVSLPGVGRKTANVIQSVVFNKAAMAVDTHVFRVSNRIGLTDTTTPLATERELVANIPAEMIPTAHHWLILHGRYVCTARTPHCWECGLIDVCKYYNSGGAGGVK